MITLPRVTKLNEHARCLVHSRSQKDVAHMVDLLDYGCGCEDWQFRHGERGSREWCIHIIAAKCALADQVIKLMKRKEKNNAKKKRKPRR